MSSFQYDYTPMPVGNPVRANGSDTFYQLGLYDGSLHAEQYADLPEVSILFQSPEVAGRWLGAVSEILLPYIDKGDRSQRIPDADGWDEE